LSPCPSTVADISESRNSRPALLLLGLSLLRLLMLFVARPYSFCTASTLQPIRLMFACQRNIMSDVHCLCLQYWASILLVLLVLLVFWFHPCFVHQQSACCVKFRCALLVLVMLSRQVQRRTRKPDSSQRGS
jgi:hypothetical protein